jgi:hypothetical protein
VQVLIAFMFGVVVLSTLELRGGPRWRTGIVLLVCAVVGASFMLQRVVGT